MVLMIRKFMQKPVEFEAMEFTGGVENAEKIGAWVVSGGGLAIWVPEVPSTGRYCGRPEHLCLSKGGGTMYAYVDDFVIKGQDGIYKPIRRKIFDQIYKEISMVPELQDSWVA